MISDIPIEELIKIFDEEFYVKKYPFVKKQGLNPIEHFYHHGVWENKWPNSNFDPNWYVRIYPEVKKTNLSALRHYLEIGKQQNFLSKKPDLISQRAYFAENLNEALKLKQKDLVSIIMTVKNPIKDWAASIHSVLCQSYQNFELIIVEDIEDAMVSDLSLPLSLHDDRVKLIRTNIPGRSNSLNFGIKYSQGSFICYLDSDNWYDPNFLLLMHYSLTGSDKKLAYCGQIRINELGANHNFRPHDLDALRQKNYIDLNVILHYRSILKDTGVFDPNLTRLIDYDFILRLIEIGYTPKEVPVFLSYYDDTQRQDRISISISHEKNYKLLRLKKIQYIADKNESINVDHEVIRPQKIRLELSSACQLRCPACPTATKETLKVVGQNLLKFTNLESLISSSPWLREIEISNYGEVFLNPELPKMLQYLHQRGLKVFCNNGANLNHINDEMLNAIVKYKLQTLTCSIDGADQKTYEKYRVRGKLDIVLNNIKKINELKRKFNTSFPKLKWQFILFDHNKHQINEARKLATELNMDFQVKTAWNSQTISSDLDEVRLDSKLEFLTRDDYKKATGQEPMLDICHQLWNSPQINWDGKLLGCCRNFWGDFGNNAFENGLIEAINGEKMNYSRLMLKGLTPERLDIPCTSCSIYKDRKNRNDWINL